MTITMIIILFMILLIFISSNVATQQSSSLSSSHYHNHHSFESSLLTSFISQSLSSTSSTTTTTIDIDDKNESINNKKIKNNSIKHDNHYNKRNQPNILLKATVDSNKFDKIFPHTTSTSSSLLSSEFSGQNSRKNTNINSKMNRFMIFDPKNFNLNELTSKNNTSIVGLIDLDSDVLFFGNLTTSEMTLLLGLENQTFSYDENSYRSGYDDDDDTGGGSGFGNFDNIDSFAILEFWPGQFILITMYSLTAFLSLSLNIITIIVWFYGDRSQSTEIWHLLVNLSLADIGMAIFCIPFTYTNVMLQHWIFPHSLCPVVNFTQLCFVFVSVWTLTIISIDR